MHVFQHEQAVPGQRHHRATRTTRPTSSTCSRSPRCRSPTSDGPSACSASRRASPTPSAAAHLAELEALAASAAKFLRRAQLYWATRSEGRPFLIKGLSPEWLEVERRIEHVAVTDVAGARHRRERHRQGARRARDPLQQPPRRASRSSPSTARPSPRRCSRACSSATCAARSPARPSTRSASSQKADGGTLFLDELGELPMRAAAQAAARARVRRGPAARHPTSAPVRVDVRLVCATNRDLPRMVRERPLPRRPLLPRRRDDARAAAAALLQGQPRGARAGVPRARLRAPPARRSRASRPAALAALASYDFPGNVRELSNADRARGHPRRRRHHRARASAALDAPSAAAQALAQAGHGAHARRAARRVAGAVRDPLPRRAPRRRRRAACVGRPSAPASTR